MSDYDIFLSYSRTNTDMMQRVRDTLREQGLKVWTDENLTPGTESWQTAIEEAIEASHTLVALLSPGFKQSEWCLRELNYARTQKRPIFPLLVEGTNEDAVPFVLSNAQYSNIKNDYANGVFSLLNAMQPVLGFADTALMMEIKQEKSLAEKLIQEQRESQETQERERRIQEEVERRLQAQQGIDPRLKPLAKFFSFSLKSLPTNRMGKVTFWQKLNYFGGSFFMGTMFVLMFSMALMFTLLALLAFKSLPPDLIIAITISATATLGLLAFILMKDHQFHTYESQIDIVEAGMILKSPQLRIKSEANRQILLTASTQKKWRKATKLRAALPYDHQSRYRIYSVALANGKEYLLSLEPVS